MDDHYLFPLNGHINNHEHEIGLVIDQRYAYYYAHHNASEHVDQNDDKDVCNQKHVESNGKID